jgi:heme-degrading monooxygenase HmoA
MYMKISWGKIQPGQWSAFEAAYRNAVDQPVSGLKGRWLARDVNDPDAGHSITLWDSIESLQNYENSDLYKKTVIPACQPFFVNEFTVKVSEVVMQTRGD